MLSWPEPVEVSRTLEQSVVEEHDVPFTLHVIADTLLPTAVQVHTTSCPVIASVSEVISTVGGSVYQSGKK